MKAVPEIAASEVQEDGGKLFFPCPTCDERVYLGMWGAAHLSACDLRATCSKEHKFIVLRDRE